MDPRTKVEFLLSLLRPTDTSIPFSQTISDEDWDDVADLSLQHGLGPFLLHRIREKNLAEVAPRGVLEKLKSATLHTALKNTKLYHELRNVLEAFQQASIPAVVLKGAHLAELVYPTIALRPMDDIDLLARREDLARTEKKLFELGYIHLSVDAERMKSLTPHHLTPFRKDGHSPIEVHWTLPSMGYIENDDNQIWSRSQPAVIASCECRVLSAEDLLLHVSIHASLHHRFGLGLRPLVDIFMIADRYRSVLDWEKVRMFAGEWKLMSGVYLTLQLSKEIVGADIPDTVLQEMRPSDFDGRLTDWAKDQIFTRSAELGDSSAMSPRIAQFLGSGSFASKVQQLFRFAFPSREEIARTSGIPVRSGRILLSYPLYWKDILLMRGGVFLRLLLHDRKTIDRAKMYQKLMDKPQHP